MTTRIMIFILGMVVCSSLPIAAQQSDSLSLKECIDIALQNNSQLRLAEHQVDLAKTNVTTARSNWLPQIDVSTSAGRTLQGPRNLKENVPVDIDPVTGQVIYEQRQIQQDATEWDRYGINTSLRQNIYDFGRTTNSIRSAKTIRQVRQHELINTQHLVIVNVKQAYYELLKAYELLTVYQEAVRAAEENLDYYESMLDLGLISKAEMYQARVNVGNQRTNLINQQNNIQFAKAQLNNALGRDPNIPIAIHRNGDKPLFPDYDFDRASEIALENNEILQALDLRVKAQEFTIKAARARYLPVIGGQVSYGRNNTDAGRVYTTELDEDYTISFGAQFSLNVFNGLSDKAEIQRQILNREMALENLREERRLLLTDVKEYFLQLEAYKDIIEINKENIEAYQENLRLQREKRRVGSGTELEVTQAQVELVRAQVELVSAEYNAMIARARLEAALGIIAES